MAVPADVQRPVHAGPWTLDEVLALPEDKRQRVELVDGNLVMSPLGSFRHQILVGQVFTALVAAVPDHLMATVELNIELSTDRLLIPDFTVINRTSVERLALPVKDLLVAGEILSPSSRTYDLVFKRELYAEAGVPYYLVVDPKGSVASAVIFELDGARYHEAARSENGVLRMERPFSAVLDLN